MGREQRRLLLWLLGVITLGATLGLAGCSDGGATNNVGGAGRLQVVATTGVIAEFAREVAGDDAQIEQLIPSGIDVHAYEPSPAMARRVAEAAVIFVNGYNLEAGLLSVVVENRSGAARLVVVATGLTARAGGHDHEEPAADPAAGHADENASAATHADENAGAATATGGDIGRELVTAAGDPHFWLDAHNAIHYVEVIRDALAAADPAHAAGYTTRAAAFVQRLEALDAEVRQTIEAVPAAQRQLVVFHDAFTYFAAAYGIEIVATVLPGGANQEASAGEVAKIVAAVRAHDVRALYAEPQFSSQLIDAIAEETGAPVLTLYSDATGGDVATYEAMMRANAQAIAEGLGG